MVSEEQLQRLEDALMRNISRVVKETIINWQSEIDSPSQAVTEHPEERQFRTRVGPLLHAIKERGGAVRRTELSLLAQEIYGDARGVGGFATGTNPSIRSEGEMRLLTERGKLLADEWWERWGKDKAGQ